MKSQKKFSVTILLLTLLLCTLRSICMLNNYQPELGYFDSSALAISMKILLVATVAFGIITPFLTSAPSSDPPTASAGQTAVSVFSGALILISGIGILMSATSAGTVTLLLGLFMMVGAAFFFTAPKKRLNAYFGFAVLAFLFCMLFHIYFDMYVAINSPLKISLQISLLTCMIYTLMLVRRAIKKTTPRFAVGIELACMTLCLSTSVSHLIYAIFGNPSALTQNVLSPFISLPLFAIGTFAASGAISQK